MNDKVLTAPAQEIRYCNTPDNVRIAYTVTGQGSPIVRAAHWLTHLEKDWESPVWSLFLHDLSRHHRIVRYDARGTGLSQRKVPGYSFEAMLTDLETVVDAAGFEKFALLGVSQGGATAIAYALKHPERVSHIVLYGAFARGHRFLIENESDQKLYDATMTMIAEGWGSENPAYRHYLSGLFLPNGTAAQVRWHTELERDSATPEMAAKIFEAVSNIDIKDMLPQVNVPVIVLHQREDRVVPFVLGQQIAALVPGARFVPLDGTNHLFLPNEPSHQVFMREVAKFLGDPPYKENDGFFEEHVRKLDSAVNKVEQHSVYRLFSASSRAIGIASAIVGAISVALVWLFG
jgi:pimeloyl-ACP methyl ester carboxylesterase